VPRPRFLYQPVLPITWLWLILLCGIAPSAIGAVTTDADSFVVSGAVNNPGIRAQFPDPAFVDDVLIAAGGATANAYPFMWVLHPAEGKHSMCSKAQKAVTALIETSRPRSEAATSSGTDLPLQLTTLRTDILHLRREHIPQGNLVAIHVPERLPRLWLYDLPRGEFHAHPWPASNTRQLLHKLQQGSASITIKPDGDRASLRSLPLHPGSIPPGTVIIRIDTQDESRQCLSESDK